MKVWEQHKAVAGRLKALYRKQHAAAMEKLRAAEKAGTYNGEGVLAFMEADPQIGQLYKLAQSLSNRSDFADGEGVDLGGLSRKLGLDIDVSEFSGAGAGGGSGIFGIAGSIANLATGQTGAMTPEQQEMKRIRDILSGKAQGSLEDYSTAGRKALEDRLKELGGTSDRPANVGLGIDGQYGDGAGGKPGDAPPAPTAPPPPGVTKPTTPTVADSQLHPSMAFGAPSALSGNWLGGGVARPSGSDITSSLTFGGGASSLRPALQGMPQGPITLEGGQTPSRGVSAWTGSSAPSPGIGGGLGQGLSTGFTSGWSPSRPSGGGASAGGARPSGGGGGGGGARLPGGQLAGTVRPPNSIAAEINAKVQAQTGSPFGGDSWWTSAHGGFGGVTGASGQAGIGQPGAVAPGGFGGVGGVGVGGGTGFGAGAGTGGGNVPAGLTYDQLIAQYNTAHNNVVGGYQNLLNHATGQVNAGLQGAMNQMSGGYGAIAAAYPQLQNAVMGDINQIGASRAQEIRDAYVAQQGQADQNLVSRGLNNTTVAPAVSRGLALDREKALNENSERVAQLRAGYRSNLGLAELDQANRAVTNMAGQYNLMGTTYGDLIAAYGMPAMSYNVDTANRYWDLAQMYGAVQQGLPGAVQTPSTAGALGNQYALAAYSNPSRVGPGLSYTPANGQGYTVNGLNNSQLMQYANYMQQTRR